MPVDDVLNMQVVDEILKKEMDEQPSIQAVLWNSLAVVVV